MDKTIKRTEDIPLIMSVKDVVNLLGISSTNAYALFNRSDFPAICVNRRKLVSRDDFFTWLEAHKNNIS